MFRTQLSISLAALTLLAILATVPATVFAQPRGDHGRHDGPRSVGFQKYDSRGHDRGRYDYEHRRPHKKWHRDHRPPPPYWSPAYRHYKWHKLYKRHWNGYRRDDGLTIIYRGTYPR